MMWVVMDSNDDNRVSQIWGVLHSLTNWVRYLI